MSVRGIERACSYALSRKFWQAGMSHCGGHLSGKGSQGWRSHQLRDEEL
jgi:hypothetical protein